MSPSIRALLRGPLPVTAPLVLNPLMARMVEAAGFPAGYLGGGSTGYQKVALEANLNLTEMCQAALDIGAVSSLPLILDGACGYGDPMHMRRTIGMSEAAGFAGIEIEDQLVPKRAHHHVGIEHIIPAELMAAKVEAAVGARRSPDFLIIARTNAVRASTMDDALRRGEIYRKAGADVLLLSMAHAPEHLRAIAERLGGPLMYLTRRGGLAGLGMTLADLGGLGYRIVADPSTPLLAAYEAWKTIYAGPGRRLRGGPAPARLGPAGEGHARRDRAGKAPRHRAHHGGKITYTGSLGRNGREKRNTVPRTPTKSYQCSVVSETVSISLRRRQSLGGNGKLFVRCSELECQYIDTNEPPCPLTLALFEAEIAERMAQRAE
jgi:methylisocitrate lyase